MATYLKDDHQRDGIDRRGFLKCMAWAGTGLVFTVTSGGVLTSCTLPQALGGAPPVDGFSFVQVSDNHIGFTAPGVNTDVIGTFQQVVDRINALPQRPGLVIHTGDLSHLAKPSELDTSQQILKTIKAEQFFTVPGEHDVIGDGGKAYRDRFLPKGQTVDYYSLEYHGVHFVALSNAGVEDSFGMLGTAQLDWLKQDLQGVNHDTPIVVFAHVPLYAVYPTWGWTTKDQAQAMDLLKPFSSVTVLNGHIHQVLSQVEGNIRFFTASSTAFPQHKPGVENQGAYKVPADQLRQLLGYRTVTIVPGQHDLAIVNHTLAS